MKLLNGDKISNTLFTPVLVSFLNSDHMLVIHPYGDRADIELVSFDKIKRERTYDVFCSLHAQYMLMHEHSMWVYCADDYFCTAVSYLDLVGVGVRQIRKFIPISNLSYHLRMIERKFWEGKLV